MGPKLRAYIAVAEQDYLGELVPHRSDSEVQALTTFLKDFHTQVTPQPSADTVTELIDELVTMDMPQAALDLGAAFPDVANLPDFRIQLALGVAAMLAGALDDAESRLRAAQELLPEEPAPYVNLVQIFLNQGRVDDAALWCEAGLDAEPNNYGLWDLYAVALREVFGEFLPEELLRRAEKRISWAGLSLAANLTTTGDSYFKASLLEKIYYQGERDPQFLIEMTAALGIAGDYAKIPPMVWQAEKLTTKGLPWQLHVHCAQAQLALGQPATALPELAKAFKDPYLPDEARAAVEELEAEAQAALEAVRQPSSPTLS